MELILLLTYTAIVTTIFKVFKIPLNSITVPTAVLGAVILLGGSLIVMNYHLPFTNHARTFVPTTPIGSEVLGQIVDVPVKPNTPINKGDVLFRIDPTRYKAEVDEQEAILVRARQVVKFREEEWIEAQAVVASARAERDRSKDAFDRMVNANEIARQRGSGRPVSEGQVEQARNTYLSDVADLEAAVSAEKGAKLRLEALVRGTDTRIAEAEARLEQAKHDLRMTVFRAPTDGVVTQQMLRPGIVAYVHPQRPLMVFAHAEKTRIAASFPQNALQRIQPGNEAEVIFPSIPGRVFGGKVDHVQPVLASGSLQAGQQLMEFGDVSDDRVPVEIVLESDMTRFTLPVGIAAEAAVYNDDVFLARHLALIRRMLLRMKSWTFFVFGPIK